MAQLCMRITRTTEYAVRERRVTSSFSLYCSTMSVRFDGLWRHAVFVRLWTASAISDVGSQVTAVALPLLAALTLAATPWQMGLLSAAESFLRCSSDCSPASGSIGCDAGRC